MRDFILFIIALLLSVYVFGQDDPWVRFYDPITELSGYNDINGNIKLPPKYGLFTGADTFYHIIAVSEKIDSSYSSYYLLKSGKKVGRDSVYIFDFTFDCESEGKILFEDRKKDRVGFLNHNGTPIIPAIYNYALPFRNGISIARRNAKRKCWDESGDTTDCEHLGWEGGEKIWINEKNEILVDSFSGDFTSINWYSKKINDFSVDTSIYITIKGKNGLTFSFVDYDKEFKKWFYNIFLQSFQDRNTLKNHLFDEITFWTQNEGWTSLERNIFPDSFPSALNAERFETSGLKKIAIHQSSLNRFIFEKDIYNKYWNSCGRHNNYKFPLYDVLLTNYKKRLEPNAAIKSDFYKDFEIDYQEHFEFLRTENGYKLLMVSVKR